MSKRSALSSVGLARLVAGAASLGLAVAGLVAAAPAEAALPGNAPAVCVAAGSSGVCTFTYGFTGGAQTFTVPDGITSIEVTAVGANGGGFDGRYSGGGGAVVSSILPVAAADVLVVQVGGDGGSGSFGGGGAPGYNGGGSSPDAGLGLRAAGGGGASDVRFGVDSLSSRVVVAGGGGGAGGCSPGGRAGEVGGVSPDCSAFSAGGPGTGSAGGAPNGALGRGGDGSFLGGGGGGGLYGGGGAGGNAGGGGGSSLGTVTGYGGSPSVTIRYTSPLVALELNDQPSTAIAGETVPYRVVGRNAQGDAWDATSVATLTSTDVSDTANVGAIRFSRAGSRTITASRDAVSVSQAVEVAPGAQTSLVVAPAADEVIAGTAVTFTTTGFDGEGNSLGDRTASTTFASGGADGSTDAVTGASVLFTTAGTRTVSAVDGTTGGSAVVEVLPDALASLALTTSSATVAAGTPVPFTVTGADRYGNDLGDLTDDAVLTTDDARDDPEGATVVFSTAGPRTVTATVGDVVATLPLTVTAGVVDSVTVAPGSTSVVAGDRVAFTVTGEDEYGNPLGDLTSSAVLTSDRAADQVDGAGITFPAAGARTVTATVGDVSGDAPVTVAPGAVATVTLLPDGSTATAGAPVGFAVGGSDAFGNDVGDLTSRAVLSTGDARDVVEGASVVFATAGPRTVTAVVDGVSDDASVSVAAGELAALAVAPARTGLRAGEEIAFEVTGTDRFGNDLGDLTADARLVSDEATDEVDGSSIAFTRAGSRTVSAAIDDLDGDVVVTVAPAEVATIILGANSSTFSAGGTVDFTVLGADRFGNLLGDVGADAVLSSDDASDTVNGTRVTFGAAGPRTVTATVGGVTDDLDLVVAAAAPVPPGTSVPTPSAPSTAGGRERDGALAATGGAAPPPAGLAALLMLAGLVLVRAGARRRRFGA